MPAISQENPKIDVKDVLSNVPDADFDYYLEKRTK
jgi:hypothetical protein